MNANSEIPSRDVRRSWRTGILAFVLIYCPVMIVVFMTTSFSASDDARQYIAAVMKRPPAPLPPLPVLKSVRRPEIAFQRDPLQPPAPAVSSKSVTSKSYRFVASFNESNQPFVIGHGDAGDLARFHMGDEVNGGTIARIDPPRVILNSSGAQQTMEIADGAPERAH